MEKGLSMEFRGLQKLSMVDYPQKMAATVFTGGCNLRCPFCHNAPLVLRPGQEPVIREDEVLDFLAKRKGFLDALVLSGGEPLMHAGVPQFLAKVKAMGYCIKLDTNGCYPQALSDLLEAGLVDYVAMDIKNSREKYALTCGLESMDLGPIEESIRLLRGGSTEYEFRTTVVAELHNEADILSICQWLRGSSRWYLQNFRDSGDLIRAGLHSPEEAELRRFAALAEPYFDAVGLRGV